MKSYLAAVCYIQIAQGFGDPRVGDMSHLEHVVKGLKEAAQVKTVRLASPTNYSSDSPWTERSIAKRRNKYDAFMPWAIACLCFFAFLQTGEAVAPSDTNFNPNVHQIQIHFVKKQQFIWEPQGQIYALCHVRLHNAKGKSSWSNVSISRLPPPNTTAAGHRTQGGTKWS